MCMYAHVCVCIECTSVCMCLRDSRRGGRRCGRPVGGARRGTCPIGRQDRAALCCRSPVFNANGLRHEAHCKRVRVGPVASHKSKLLQGVD